MSTPITTFDLATVNLTTVPATHPAFTSRRVNWNDQADVHRAVMSLFPVELPGPDGSKRSASAILHRLETPTSGPRVLVQSSVAPRRNDFGIATTTLSGLTSLLVPGLRVRMRIDVNAVRTQSRTGKRIPVVAEDISAFLLNPDNIDQPGLLAGALDSVSLEDVTPVLRLVGRVSLHVVRISGEAVVADPVTLAARLVNGVGRGKSYGCGLLTVVPA